MFAGKKILVCGMARSGQAAALALRRLGAEVTASDTKKDVKWSYDPAAEGIICRLGQPPVLNPGLDLIIISPAISVRAPFVKEAKRLGIPVWGETELAYRLCPCPMAAITGTNGKTTVTMLVGEILKKHNPGTVIAGNIGVPLTGLVEGLKSADMVVAEVSSFQLETIEAFRPAISAVLNITPDHLDRHGTMEVYTAAKARIFENQRQDDITVLNYDNPITREMNPPGRKLYFSKRRLPEGVYLRGGLICASLGGASETVVLPLSETKVMAENALAAAAISLAAGVSPGLIADTLREFKGVPHRLEYVATAGGIDYYNDSKATNVDAAIKALEYFSCPVVLIGGGYDKNTDFNPWAACFKGKVASLILIGQTAPQIAEACENQGFAAYENAASLQEAVARAANLARPGQAVLFSPACASFDMFKDFEERGKKFKEYVKGVCLDD